MKPAAAKNSSRSTGISPKTFSEASRWASALLEVNDSRAAEQHKGTAGGPHTFIFRLFLICKSGEPTIRGLFMLRSVPCGRASRLIQICYSEFRPIDFQRKSRSSRRPLPRDEPCWEKT